ncbi:alpha/beta hydrolase family protein [Draconibacterium mangrovi]|uniref:alpha/beta hydrolase family protein n=1 Tax=Draconibacterium mangrovi TaxID=2697469 RepID=UPI0013D3EAB5|nr:alpha/beta fold hydrolase [Draconibacterium mangrovi]
MIAAVGSSFTNCSKHKKTVSNNYKIDEIPVQVCYIDDNHKKGLLILSHGFNGNKEQWSDRIENFAEMGYYVLALDNRYHGERKGITIAEKILTNDGMIDIVKLRKAIDENAQDISTLIDYFSANSLIDTSKIGMMGISMGGFITYSSLVRDPRISFAIPIISSPYWDDIPEDARFLDSAETRKNLEAYALKNSPANRFERFYDRKIFALIGMNDTHFNPNRVVDFYDKLKLEHGTKCPDIKLNRYNVGHNVTETMWQDIENWLSEEL